MALPLAELRDSARAAGKRLVLCGHSLGGAVAMLGAVSLLREESAAQRAAGGGWGGDGSGEGGGGGAAARDPQIRCISFAAPPVGNEALAREVAAAGWDQYISNFVLPGGRGHAAARVQAATHAAAGDCRRRLLRLQRPRGATGGDVGGAAGP
jgi:hypothetical protein